MYYNEGMKRVVTILGGLALANVLAWVAVAGFGQAHSLSVTFFDVGQGDAIFIETPDNHQILIDGGPSGDVLEKLGKEMPFWDRTIDLVVLTHPDFDHLAGLIEVLKRYEVENILWSGIACATAECSEWQRLIGEEGSLLHIARAGQRIRAGSVALDVLYPFESLAGKTVENTNGASIVARLVFGEKSFLFTGDAYQAVERQLLEKGADVDSDVLKVGHHGSKSASSESFVGAVSPEIAVISAGPDNKYGHPHQETLSVFEKYGINVLRTDINKDIKIICNSQSLRLK